MDIFENFERLGKKSSSIILYSLLNRIPIIVIGDDEDNIDDFLIELSNLIFFRKESVFYTDFISFEDYMVYIQNEDADYGSERVLVRCPCGVSDKFLEIFKEFKSCLIGVKLLTNGDLKSNTRKIDGKVNNYVLIRMFSDDIELKTKGFNAKSLNLDFEERIMHRVYEGTEKAITRMIRVLKENTKAANLNKEILQEIMNFKIEKTEIKRNFVRLEFQDFYNGAQRAFYILSRMSLLNSLDIPTAIGGKTLLDTIHYSIDNIERILSFIDNEWGLDFSNLIKNGKNSSIGEKIQSLWG